MMTCIHGQKWISKQEIMPAVVGKHEIDMMYKRKSFLISALPMSRTRSLYNAI